MVPRACAPYRARTKGADERPDAYVKRNTIAGHRFGFAAGMGRTSGTLGERATDVRAHGITGKVPLQYVHRSRRQAPDGPIA